MNRNRLKSPNSLQSRNLYKLFAGCLVLTLFGLVFVFLQIRIIRMADDNRKLEVALDDIHKKNSGLQLQIERLKAPQALERKLVSLRLGMVPVSNLQILDAKIQPAGDRPARLLAKQEARSE